MVVHDLMDHPVSRFRDNTRHLRSRTRMMMVNEYGKPNPHPDHIPSSYLDFPIGTG